MYTCRAAISMGDVIARHGRFFVVVRIGDQSVTLVPIRPACLPRHRADVRPLDGEELDVAGLGGSDIAVMCHERLSVTSRGAVRVGAVSRAMWARIEGAMRREDASSALEASGGLGSALLALTTSSGRRVVAARPS